MILFLVLAQPALAGWSDWVQKGWGEATQLPSPLSEELGKEIQMGGAQAASLALNVAPELLLSSDPRYMVARLVAVALSVVGILFIALLVYGGALWLTSGGSEEQIKKAKNVLGRGVLGLVIVLASYSVAAAVQWWLVKATTQQVFWKAQDPRVGSACGTQWADYQSALGKKSDAEVKRLLDDWNSCTDKAIGG
jgi:hypothetical protein